MSHSLPKLPYAYDHLEPHIDARTMEIHHTKHHQAYVDKLNDALAGTDDLLEKPIEDLIGNLNDVPEDIRTAVRNNGGGHANHSLFWTVLAKDGGEPEGDLADAMSETFGSLESFKEQFAEAAKTRFGSGWAWLYIAGGSLQIGSTTNQDSPLMGQEIAGISGVPILGLDVWEHAYYVKYFWNRAEYIQNWWNVVNWKQVQENYARALQG